MRSPSDKPQRIFVVTPDGRLIATHVCEGVTSRYVDSDGHLRPRAAAEGFRLLSSFAKERPGFLAAYTAWCEAAERGDAVTEVPEEWIPPSIVKMREKSIKSWEWPALPAKVKAK